MTIEVSKNKGGIIELAITDEMTIYTCLEQKRQLMEYFNTAKRIQIDLSAVTEIDSAGVQLLMFAKHEARLHDIPLTLVRHNQAVVEVLELLNLGNHFGDPIVISADWKSS